MTNYTVIPVSALLCYLFLLLAFLASKKDKIMNSFLLLLTIFSMWTLGSFCMRMHVFPSANFWFSLSIDALFLMCYGYFSFISAYTDQKSGVLRYVWLVGSLVIIAINHATGGFFIAAPQAREVNGSLQFVYSIGWPIILPFLFNALIVIHCLYFLLLYSHDNFLSRHQLLPIILGIFLLFFGNIAASFPVFKSFPIDILSGLVNALLLFFALYHRRLFRLTLLVSRSVCYLVSAVLAFILFSYLVGIYQDFLMNAVGVFGSHSILVIAVTYLIAVLIFYYLLKHFVDHVFIREELIQADILREFSTSISRTLKANEVLSLLIQVIQDTVHTEKSYVCLLNYEGTAYEIVQSTSPLDEKNIVLKKDNPLISCLTKQKECLLMEDLKRTPYYKAMWEKEKQQLALLDIQCILPLMDENELVGLVLLSSKEKNGHYSIQDLNYLQSLDSISSIAVKNARLYEKAYWEARTDKLTGLLNRTYFYETLNQEYEKNPNQELSLILISLDDFKLYNQLYGSVEGDRALQNAARIISGSAGSGSFSARYEGKIFAVILPGCDVLTAAQLAETIRKQIMNMNHRLQDAAIKSLTCSCGICTIPLGATDPQQLISNADLALYNAKKNGKNCTRTFSQNISGSASRSSRSDDPGNFKPYIYEEYAATIYALTAAIDAKDHYTFHHSQNVCYYAIELARACGLDDDCVEIIKESALLHDIGKIGIPETILKKPGRLTPEEYEIMKSHVEQSIGIIRFLPSLDYVIPAVIGHHERYDGNGYPRKLKGEEIPLLARILCIADSFDAMVSKRSYKSAFTVEYAMEQLELCSGTQFDPKLTKLFIRLLNTHQIDVHTEPA